MASAGVGTEFRRWNNATKVWDKIAEINSIAGPTASVETIDTTALDTVGAYRTFIPSFIDAGEITLEMNFTRDSFESFLDDMNARTTEDWVIGFPDPDNTTYIFQGFVTGQSVAVPTDDKITVTVTIKITGQPTLESGSVPSSGVAGSSAA